MLEIRLNCGKFLANTSNEAMICNYECTFCKDCVETVLMNVCPNCGGGFEKRPTRPKAGLEKHPPKKDKILKPVKHNLFLKQNKDIHPRKR